LLRQLELTRADPQHWFGGLPAHLRKLQEGLAGQSEGCRLWMLRHRRADKWHGLPHTCAAGHVRGKDDVGEKGWRGLVQDVLRRVSQGSPFVFQVRLSRPAAGARCWQHWSRWKVLSSRMPRAFLQAWRACQRRPASGCWWRLGLYGTLLETLRGGPILWLWWRVREWGQLGLLSLRGAGGGLGARICMSSHVHGADLCTWRSQQWRLGACR